MSFKVVWDEKAHEELTKLDTTISRRIVKKVTELKENPYSKDIKKLVGIPGFRLRIGDYRIIFEIENDTILILKVGHRRNVYD